MCSIERGIDVITIKSNHKTNNKNDSVIEEEPQEPKLSPESAKGKTSAFPVWLTASWMLKSQDSDSTANVTHILRAWSYLFAITLLFFSLFRFIFMLAGFYIFILVYDRVRIGIAIGSLTDSLADMSISNRMRPNAKRSVPSNDHNLLNCVRVAFGIESFLFMICQSNSWPALTSDHEKKTLLVLLAGPNIAGSKNYFL